MPQKRPRGASGAGPSARAPASKAALQSTDEDLTRLNSELGCALERERATSIDLLNILHSTDVATLVLDADLKIRFFTPATKSIFNVLPTDIGRPLSDLQSLTTDGLLSNDARQVLTTLAPIEREIVTANGVWFIRRILPYRAPDKNVDAVVITFTDISDRKLIAKALETAKQQAEQATIAKSRFLAAASHDLRQPLQTLVLLHGLLEKIVEGDRARKLVARLDDTLGSMSGMLNALLDINKIAAGTVRAEMITFPINDLLDSLRTEFTYLAQAKRLTMRVMPCDLAVRCDPLLLEQMLRNLLSNALKYTKRGKILLGCRRRKGALVIEVWDTGVGIPADELQAIFEEYHQVDNVARERSLGLGLGLSIVQRLANLVGAKVCVRSRPGKGSVFAIDLKLAKDVGEAAPKPVDGSVGPGMARGGDLVGSILVVEDDPGLRDLLKSFLDDEGHDTTAAPDGVAATKLFDSDDFRPDLVLADYNLPNGLNGLQLKAKLAEKLERLPPFIILTGDISDETLREIAKQDGVQLNKPVRLKELAATVRQVLAASRRKATSILPSPPVLATSSRLVSPSSLAADPASPVVFVVDDDSLLRETIRNVLEADGRFVEEYPDCESFLDAYRPGRDACLLIDAYLPGMSGLELLKQLHADGNLLPAIMITGDSDVAIAVQAMKAGALDFIEKPVSGQDLLASVDRALEQSRNSGRRLAWRDDAARHVAELSPRQRQIMQMVLAGHPSKNIAADLGISQRTVENHRAAIMKKTGAKSLPALARLALAAEGLSLSLPAPASDRQS